MTYETCLFIDGEWREARGGGRFPVVNPATEQVIAEVADGTVEDAADAMEAAAAALAGWGRTPPRQRAEILRRCFDLMVARKEMFATLIATENGKSFGDAMGETLYAAEFFRWFSEEAVRNLGQMGIAPASGARILVHHKPAGVAILVTPWNFPAAMGTRKIAPALAAGCTCILKPASETPLTMLALAALMADAGVPKGVVNILPSQRAGAVVRAMLHDPRARVVSFTGSTAVGRILLREAADNVINPRMELGGNAPFLVFDDADIDAAVAGAMVAKMRNMGEACTAANRFYVQGGVHDAFAARLADAMAALKVGNPADRSVAVGPMVTAKARDGVAAFVEDAVKRGARVVTGGKRPTGNIGFYYEPTVLVDVPDDALCMNDEIFGPVAPIRRFESEDEAIRLANATEYGLAAYVFTKDIQRGLRVGEALEFGMIGLNRGLMSDPAAPFGGTKQSGLGREGAHEGLMEFLETQYISVEW